LQMLREQAARTPPGQWVRVVGGWSEFQFEERRLPTLEEINEATGNVPTFILYLYAKAWINKAGLKALDFKADAKNPPGGLIEKDHNGNPTGLLVAEPNAFILYSTLAKLPELSLPEKFNSTMQFVYELNRLGVTAAMDAGGGFQTFPDDYAITDSLHRSGNINIRLPHYLFAQKQGTELQDYQHWSGLVDIHKHQETHSELPDYYVAGGGENLVAEAADFENFQYPRPELPASMEKKLFDVITFLAVKRWPFRLHATYNESISRDLDVIEAVNKSIPLTGLPWFFDHAETISAKNLERIKNLGGGISIQHRMAYQGEYFIRRYGANAASQAPPLASMIAGNIPIALGTDGTRVASYNPWIALYWVVTGKTVGGTETLSPENRLDRITALTLFTSGGYRLIHENMKGQIVKNFAADVVILNKDYFTVSETEIREITSLLTIADGKVVYGDRNIYPFVPVKKKAIPDWSPVNFY
jgi:predicted amidohydrolase YtcJ